MKRTSLYNKHIQLGAKMVPFAGFEMPVSYFGINQEHLNVRNNVGVFDVSHMGEFSVVGKDAEKLIQNITSNDVSALYDGKVQYSCFTNNEGGIIDDLLVYRFEADKYMLVVNASNIEKDFNWVVSQAQNLDVVVKDRSDEYALLAVQGPNALKVIQKLTEVNVLELPYYHAKVDTLAGIENVVISATGYTGSGGLELYVRNEFSEKLWDAVFEAGKEYNIQPAGLGSRDTLRLEMGFCLYGNDINDNTSPLEAGLNWITKLNTQFVGADVLIKQKEEGVNKKLVAITFNDKLIPRQHHQILDANNNVIGEITSGTMSPSLGYPIALGYVSKEFAKVDGKIYLNIRNKMVEGTIVKLPFLKV